MTRVVLVARFDETGHSHGALQQRALERLGCRVTPVNLDRPGGWLKRLAGRDLNTQLERSLRDAEAELILVISPDLPPLSYPALRAAGAARWIHWYPTTGPGLLDVPKSAESFDVVYVPGRAQAEQFAARTGRAIRALPPACDPSFHRPLQVRGPFRANVVFAGTASPRREELLAPLVEFGLAVWGPGWKKTRLKDHCQGEELKAEDYVRAYAGATVGINIHREPVDGLPGGDCNRRLFELGAIGTAQAVDHRTELADHFEPDDELLMYRDPDQLRELVRSALADQERRDRVASAARRRALSRHTYMHRLTALLELGKEG